MDFNEYYHSESGRYPEYVTQKEMCVILGICKSKAYLILKQGLIPFEYAVASTGRIQKIRTADILQYQYERVCFNGLKNEYIEEVCFFYQRLLKDFPQVLLVSDIMRITGYTRTTVNNWILNGKLKALTYKEKRIKSPHLGKETLIAKEAFVDFLASSHYRSIVRKSEAHKEQEKNYKRLFIRFLVKRGVPNG